MPTSPDELAHDAMNAIAGLQGRLQLLQRRTRMGNGNTERAILDLELALECLRRLPPLIDALGKAAATGASESSLSVGTPHSRHPILGR
jgi:hypothetical protein